MHSGGVVMNRSEARAKESSKRIARSDVCGAREGKKPCLVTGWGWRHNRAIENLFSIEEIIITANIF